MASFSYVCNKSIHYDLALADKIHAHNPPKRKNGKREIESLQPESKRASTWKRFAKTHNIPDSVGHAQVSEFDLSPQLHTKDNVEVNGYVHVWACIRELKPFGLLGRKAQCNKCGVVERQRMVCAVMEHKIKVNGKWLYFGPHKQHMQE